MKLSNNFTKEEFDSNDGADMPSDVLGNVIELARNLQIIRDYFGKAIKVNSGYRSPMHNKKIGGSANSQHLLGKASDIVVSGVDPSEVADKIEYLIENGLISEGGVGRYDTFTHYDIRGAKARWNG